MIHHVNVRMKINIFRSSRSSTEGPYLIKLKNEIPVPIALYPSIYSPVFFKNVYFESPVFSFSHRFSLVVICITDNILPLKVCQ